MAATIREVARKAGVSVATVSRAFNDSGPVSDEARRRIEEAAAELRYAPNGAARSLVTRRTRTLGAILPEVHGEFFSEVIRAIDETARSAGYHLLVSGSHSHADEAKTVLRALKGRVDGLFVMSPELDVGTLLAGVGEGLPAVFLNHPSSGGAHPSLSVDNRGGAYAMTRHLLELGHRRVAFVKGPADNHDAIERLRGFRAAMEDADLPSRPELEFDGDFREAGGYAAGRRILRLAEGPTAVFAANDAMAIGALCALREEGVRVPAEVALAGFDDIPMARYLTPALTSVHVPIRRLGVRAVEQLIERVEEDGTGQEPEPPAEEVLPTRIEVRASTAGEAETSTAGEAGRSTAGEREASTVRTREASGRDATGARSPSAVEA